MFRQLLNVADIRGIVGVFVVEFRVSQSLILNNLALYFYLPPFYSGQP